MVRLETSEALKRIIRRDDPCDLVVPTPTLLQDAIKAGKTGDALQLLDYVCYESKSMHDGIVSMTDDAITYLAHHFGEEEVPKFFKSRYVTRVKDWLSTTPGVRETLERCVEMQRSHFSKCTLVEEPERYVLTCDPCGSGGRLRRNKNVATTRGAYPWSWGQKNMPYYCSHCCTYWEIVPIELRGYPIRINLITEDPSDPCIHLYYKRPELIPDEYFTRIGLRKIIPA